MRLSRPQISMRMMLVNVAVVAFALETWRKVEEWRARILDYRLLALDHGGVEWIHLHPQECDGKPIGCFGPQFHANPRKDPLLAKYYGAMRRKYEFAASYPWGILWPDPPPPEFPLERPSFKFFD